MALDQQAVRTLYKKLLGLYPRAFREQLGESMEQTFNDLFNARKRQTERGLFSYVSWLFLETAVGIFKEHVRLIRGNMQMESITTNPRSAAIISFILALPITSILSLLMLNIEPDFGPLQPLLYNPDPDQPDIVGSLIVLGAMLLLPVAFILNLRVILEAKRAGKSMTAHPMNLVLAVATLALITFIVGSIIVDQYPCWIGVPNCD